LNAANAASDDMIMFVYETSREAHLMKRAASRAAQLANVLRTQLFCVFHRVCAVDCVIPGDGLRHLVEIGCLAAYDRGATVDTAGSLGDAGERTAVGYLLRCFRSSNAD
jgi:hypothetical protein